MKVIIVTYLKGASPFIEELKDRLRLNNFEVIIFDMFDMITVSYIDNKSNIVSHISNKFLIKLFNIKLLGTIFRIIFYKIYFLVKPLKADHIAIHYALAFYTFFVSDFKKMSKKFSVCLWGSDFYRISRFKKRFMTKLYDSCHSIIFCNTVMAIDFIDFYKKISINKIQYTGFGIAKLDLIHSLSKSNSLELMKNSLNIPKDKIIVSIGYNGSNAQQHLYIIEKISQLSRDMLSNLFLVIPFGYGGEVLYKNRIIEKLVHLGVEYNLYDEFLSDINVSKLRLCTDIVINAQISDAASASIQEHLFSGNLVLVGDWLPYKYFEDNGIWFWKFNNSNFQKIFCDILSDFSISKLSVSKNAEAIRRLSSWDNRILEWSQIYNYN